VVAVEQIFRIASRKFHSPQLTLFARTRIAYNSYGMPRTVGEAIRQNPEDANAGAGHRKDR
jgi:hypothetical protein